ncbi:hypothetical protein OOT46_25650 [Aquabacterium sp. A7-Y]|uniref:hypothetical protein n=1 Tax=Aquabacterium sp. A7-Y TaxID=1349605 RepID=UPI00223DA9C0|nr:hypothetical protein [Aquabacterium sp. A7-Y]MCW7541200.1 hypothetical protein [Aquabacterium sp. A7-Y]
MGTYATANPSGAFTAPSSRAGATLHFVPVELEPAAGEASASDDAMAPVCPDIHIELKRGSAQLVVRWPSTQAASCAAWLRELAATALKE